MVTKTLSFRLPVEIVEAIEADASATGQSRTRVVTAILSKFYDRPYVVPQSVTLDHIQEQVNELRLLMHSLEPDQIN